MLDYQAHSLAGRNWAFAQTCYDPAALGKTEAVMAQGNGYIGIRAAEEETLLGQIRGTFIAGVFNRFSNNEVCELPNLPDVTGMDILFNGQRFDPAQSTVLDYEKKT